VAFYADLHIHSKHSRATSRDCDLEHLAWWAGRKGIAVVGTGDFTHPAWLAEIREKLVPDGSGLYRLRDDLERERLRTLPAACRAPVHFLLSVEISTIYKKAERTRKVHHLVYAPDLDTVERFNRRLGTIGNLKSDGRPILGLDSRHLLEIVLESGDDAYLVPAHIWTPWFAVLGSMSGFDAVADCYGDLADHVFAVETGLSSDPAMNWRVSSLDRYRLLSSSDAHSPSVLGREAAVFACAPDYFAMRHALETGEGYGGTVEFFPEEGKYHLDGHRKCGVRLAPSETRAHAGRCPGCDKPVTVGVLSRVEDLADRPEGAELAGAAPFRNLVPLAEILGEIAGVGAKSKRVAREVEGLIDRLGPELDILEHLPLEDVGRRTSTLVCEALARLRRGQVIREAGYDGEYGVIRMFDDDELAGPRAAGTLFEVPPRAPSGAATARVASGAGAAGRDGAADVEPARWRSPGSLHQTRDPTEADARRSSRDADGGDRFASRPAPRGDSSDGALASDSPLLAALDPAQRAAAAHGSGPVLVVAGPGTGKTRTLTHRLAHVVGDRGVAPERCVAITFTQRAAQELRSRVAALLPREASRVLVTTFHGLGLQILREQRVRLGLHRGFRVVDESERLALAGEVFGLSAPRARRRLAELSRARRSMDATDARRAAEAERRLGELERWRQALWERDLVDFDDLIETPVRLLEDDAALTAHYRARFPWVFVDEYQDVDALQYRLLRRLSPPGGQIFAIGDPDQAIYGFRGSDVGFFLKFGEDNPGTRVFRLERSHRSSPAIVAGALQAIAPSSLVAARALSSAATSAEAASHIAVHAAATEREEAEHVAHTIERLLGGTSYFSIDSGRVAGAASQHAPARLAFSDFAVLYRTAAQARPIAEAFARAGIPFQCGSHERLAARPAVQAIAAELRSAAESSAGTKPCSEAAERAGPGPHLSFAAAARPIGDATMRAQLAAAAARAATARGADPEQIREAAAALAVHAESSPDLDSFLAAIDLAAEVDTLDPRADRVSLLTLHAAKGLEFQVIFLTGVEEGLLPLRFGRSAGPPADEERRLFFVGMTRARSHLHLSWCRRRLLLRGAAAERRPSPFLGDIDEALLARLHPEARATRLARTRSAAQLVLAL
jgi:uncharacterized protein (TIGR00375 family)